MNKISSGAAFLFISLERMVAGPLHIQLAGRLRRLILERSAGPGEKLPSSRTLAEELSARDLT